MVRAPNASTTSKLGQFSVHNDLNCFIMSQCNNHGDVFCLMSRKLQKKLQLILDTNISKLPVRVIFRAGDYQVGTDKLGG